MNSIVTEGFAELVFNSSNVIVCNISRYAD